MASLSVLVGMLGRRATALYLLAIAVMSVIAGLTLDLVYSQAGIDVQAAMGQAGEVVPAWLQLAGVAVLLAISVKPLSKILNSWRRKLIPPKTGTPVTGCGCS